MASEKDITDMMNNFEDWIDNKAKRVANRYNEIEIKQKLTKLARDTAIDFYQKNNLNDAQKLFEQLFEYFVSAEDLYYLAKIFYKQQRIYLACIYYAYVSCRLMDEVIKEGIEIELNHVNYKYEFLSCLELALIYSKNNNIIFSHEDYRYALDKLETPQGNEFTTDGMEKLGISRKFNNKRQQSAEFLNIMNDNRHGI